MANINRIIRIGSRASRLAVVQAEIVARQIEDAFPDIRTEIVTMKTTGDMILDKTLDQIGGKGLFVRELDEALRNGTVDITVHSLKDLPKDIPEDLSLLAFTKREDPRDVMVLPEGADEPDLTLQAGTSSLRRSIQLKELYPGIETSAVRGNVETRLRKLDAGQYSCLVMAAAGLKRIGLEHRISRYFSTEEMIPAAGQGILAVQARTDDADMAEVLEICGDMDSKFCALAERAFVRAVGADCGSADTAFAWTDNGTIHLNGLGYEPGSGNITQKSISGSMYDAEKLGTELAAMIIEL